MFSIFHCCCCCSKASLIPNRQWTCHCVLSVVQEGQRDEAVLYCFLFGKYLFSDRQQFSLQEQCCLLILPVFTSPEVDDRLALVVNQLVVVFLVRVRRISRFLHQLWTSTFKRQHLQLFFIKIRRDLRLGWFLLDELANRSPAKDKESDRVFPFLLNSSAICITKESYISFTMRWYLM